MKGFWKHIAASASISAVFVICALALAFSAAPAGSPPVQADAGLHSLSLAGPLTSLAEAWDRAAEGLAGEGNAVEVATVEKAAQPVPATAALLPAEPPAAEQSLPESEEALRTSAIDPDLPAPGDLEADFPILINAPGRRVELAWSAVSHPQLEGYVLLRWGGGSFDSMLAFFRDLEQIVPSVEPLVDELEVQFSMLSQSGWTYTERNDILADTGAAMDPLLAAMATTPGAEDLMDKMVTLATRYTPSPPTANNYNNTRFSNNTYYLYVVSAAYGGGDTSVPSNCEGAFTVIGGSGQPPGPPGGFTATAYDPDVALEWNRLAYTALAGYDVYIMQNGNAVKLNVELITRGTEFIHLGGIAGSRYRIHSVDIAGRTRNPANATSVLAPATVYDAEDPAWVYAGSWALEDYRAIETSGGLLWVGHWGEDPPPDPPYEPEPVPTYTPASASLTFTGRRIRVYSARYWACGNVNFYIDGELKATFNLHYDGGYSNVAGYVPPLWQQLSFISTGLLSKEQHTLTVEAAGSGGAQGQHFVNFEYAESR
jgi:hypothetical protein